MFDWRSIDEWKRLFRYYQAGIVNTAFGYSLFAIFIYFGANIYVAQISSHAIGMLFNYFTYSRYTFGDIPGNRWRFFGSYIVNYFINLTLIIMIKPFIQSLYAVGLIVTLITSLLNYFILKIFVFSRS
jgi:putative flippase GtrA